MAVAVEPSSAAPVEARTGGLYRRATTRGLALPAIVLGGAVALYLVGLAAAIPSTIPDEAIYAELARSIAAHGRFEFAGVPFPVLTFGPLYPLLLAPIFALAPSAHDAYLAARGLNALLFASAAVPLWFIARRVVTPRTALLVASIGIFLPASVYTVKLQTESLAYPLVLWAVLAALRLVERPSFSRQAVLAICVAAAALARFELLVLAPALVSAVLVAGAGSLASRVRRMLPSILACLLGAVGSAVVVFARGAGDTAQHGFDAHRITAGGVSRWFFGTLGVIDLSTGIVPFAAFLLLSATVARRSRTTADEHVRRLVVATAAVGLGCVAAGSLYLASIPPANQPPTPTDRYAFYVLPLVVVAFAAWLERGAHRPRTTRWIAAVAAVLPLAIAVTTVRGGTTIGNSNALGLLPWIYLRAALPHLWLVPLVTFCCFCGLRFVRRSSDLDALVKPAAITLMLTGVCAFFFVVAAAQNLETTTPRAGWLDANAPAKVVALWIERPDPSKAFTLWEIALANSKVTRVYYVSSPDPLAIGFERRLVRQADGTLTDRGTPVRADYVLTTSGTRIAGEVVAREKGFLLYRVHSPLRLLASSRAGGPGS